MEAARSYRDWAADSSLLLGGGAAILMQLTDPVLARSVARHSRFETDPAGRLLGTLRYVYAVSLGDADAARASAMPVETRHHGVPGAVDPERQAWVAATLYWAGVRAYELLHPPLEGPLADEILRRSARLGTALNMPPEAWPRDRTAFAAWWDGRIAAAEVSADARHVARALLHPRHAPWWLRAAMPTARLVTVRMLPPRIRSAYGLRWTPTHEARYRRRIRALRILWTLAPRPLRELPSRLLTPTTPRRRSRTQARRDERRRALARRT